MKYETFINEVENLNFIRDEEEADTAIKTVLGILVSRMITDNDAREFTESLPAPLTFEKLRGHQAGPRAVHPYEYMSVLETELRITRDEADRLVKTVLDVVKRDMPPHVLRTLNEKLPQDWNRLMR